MFYSFERAQYLEMIQLWEAPTGDMAGKNANQTYGAEHLCRLLGKYSFPRTAPLQLLTNQPQFPSLSSSLRPTWTSSPSATSARRSSS